MTRKISQKQDQILCRRSRIIELRSKGFSERKMAEILGIPRPTINQDLRILKRQAATQIKTFLEKDLPHEAELLLENVNALLGVAWSSLEEELRKGKSPYAAISSIIQILNLKETLIDDKIEVATYTMKYIESKEIDLKEQAMKEAYESDYRRRQAVF